MSAALLEADEVEQDHALAEQVDRLASTGSQPCAEQPPGWKSALDVLTAAAWIAVATGLIESAFWLVQRYVFHAYIFLHPGFWWMSPTSQLAVMALPAAVLAAVAWRRPRWDLVSAGVTLFSLVGWLNLVLLAPTIHDWAWLLAGCGLATATGRWFERRRERCLAIMRRTTWPALVLLAAAPVSQHWLNERQEQAAVAALPPPPAGAPNVLLIVLDAVKAEALEIYGADRAVAPHLAALAEQGVVFENAWSTAPWTLPSQAGMFTGRLPRDLSADWLSPLTDNVPTLAEELSSRGWRTGAFVGNTRYCSAETGLAHGFSRYDDYRLSAENFALCTALGRKFLLSTLAVDCGFVDWPARKRADEVTRGLVDWLPQRGDRPFFAFLNYFDAHDPYLAPPGFATRQAPSRDDVLLMRHWWWLPKDKLTPEQVELMRVGYEDCIRGLDDHVGRMLAQLRERGELDNTIIVITADHGEHFGDHGLYLHGNSLYEPLIHVPLVVVWPGHLPAGRRVSTPVSLAGLPNTVQELTGGQPTFPGTSWTNAWNAEEGRPTQPSIVVAEIATQCGHPPCHGHSPITRGPMQCVREGNLKYLHYGDGVEELFDLARDPAELRNLATEASHKTDLDRLRAHWQQSRPRVPVDSGATSSVVRP
jgi:arylsulfatase A-like enzyme